MRSRSFIRKLTMTLLTIMYPISRNNAAFSDTLTLKYKPLARIYNDETNTGVVIALRYSIPLSGPVL